MTCDQARLLMSERLDGRLDAATIAALDKHMAGCPACRERWRSMQRVSALFAGTDVALPPPDFTSRVMTKLGRAEQRRQSPFWRWTAVLAPLAAAAVLALVFVIQAGSAVAADVTASAGLSVTRVTAGVLGAGGGLSALASVAQSSLLALYRPFTLLPATLVEIGLLWLALGTLALSYILARVIHAYKPAAVAVRR